MPRTAVDLDDEVDLSPDAVRARLLHALEVARGQSGALADEAAILAADHATTENRRQALTEGDTTSVERYTVGRITAGVQRTIAEIDAALLRLDAGTYGQCTSCTKPIPAPRLEVRPAAAECISCASRR